MSDHSVRSQSSHPFVLVAPFGVKASVVDGRYVPGVVHGVKIVGYAASQSKAVQARARRLGAKIVPLVDGVAHVSY